MKLASYRWISCSNIRRKKRERSTPYGVISRLYTSSNIIQLVTVLIKSTDRLRKHACVRTQLAVAITGCYTHCDPPTEKTDAGALSVTAASILFIANLPHTGKQHRLQQDVRTQLAIAMVEACKRNSKKVEKERTVKQMKLASYRWVDQPVNACKRNSKKEKK